MKTDLATAIVAAVVGALLAYFVTNLFIGEIEDFSFTSIDPSISADIVAPDIEVFNFKALNPTVEVYVDCTQFNEAKECIDNNSTLEEGTDNEVNQENG